jgi:HK97 gp10 family phage protein
MPFGIEIIGLDKLLAGFQGAPKVTEAEMRTAMTTSCLLIEGTARALVPRRTGALGGSIGHHIDGNGTTLTGEIGPSKGYGLYVETGTRPHWMPPGILPFPAMRTIARRGTRAQPFMKPAFDQNVARVTKLFEDIGIKVVGSISHG